MTLACPHILKHVLPAFLLFFITANSSAQADWLTIGTPIVGSPSDFLGSTIDIAEDGNRFVVGSASATPEYVAIYENLAGTWTQVGASILGATDNNSHGYRVAISGSGNIVAASAILAPDNGTNSGHVRIFEETAGVWTQLGQTISGASGERYGSWLSLSADGLTMAIGTQGNDTAGNNRGQVDVFAYDGASWVVLGSPIYGEADNDFSGSAVVLSDDGLTVAIAASQNDDGGGNSGHVRVYAFDGAAWNQMGADLDGSTGGDRFGSALDLSGDGLVVAVGAPDSDQPTDHEGYARMFSWDGVAWVQQGADIFGTFTDAELGSSIGLNSDGSRLAVGLPDPNNQSMQASRVHTYAFDGSNWQALGNPLIYGTSTNSFGRNLALSGDGNTLIVGNNTFGEDASFTGQVSAFEFAEPPAILPDAVPLPEVLAECIVQSIAAPTATLADGSAIVASTTTPFPITAPGNTTVTWTYDDGLGNTLTQDQTVTIAINTDPASWSQVGDHIPGDLEFDLFGHTVALSGDGNTLAVGAPFGQQGAWHMGFVRLFELQAETWVQVGTDLFGSQTGEVFGFDLALDYDGSHLAIGARDHDGAASETGRVVVYQRSGNDWIQLGADLQGSAQGDHFGHGIALSLDAKHLAVGAPQDESTSNAEGYAQVFEWTGAAWMQMGATLQGADQEDSFGFDVALSGGGLHLAVGAPENDDGILAAGSVQVFSFANGSWTETGSPMYGQGVGDDFGAKVGINATGTRVAALAPGVEGDATVAGYAYVFERSASTWTEMPFSLTENWDITETTGSMAFSADGKHLSIGQENWSGDIVAIGRAVLVREEGGVWTDHSEPVEGSHFDGELGASVALSANGKRLAAGAHTAYLFGQESGLVSVFDFFEPAPLYPDASTLDLVFTPCAITAPTTPSATEICGAVVTGTPNVAFPLTAAGAHLVTWSFENGEGENITQDQLMVVPLSAAPVPDAIELSPLVNACTVEASTAPTATDDCDGAITGTTETLFPITDIGDHLITWTFTDIQGNQSTQTQEVTVEQYSGPNPLIVPDVLDLPLLTEACQITSAPAPTATTACGVQLTGFTFLEFPVQDVGSIPWFYEDSEGNILAHIQLVNITNTTPPVPDLALLPEVTAECSLEELTSPSATDDCSPNVTVSHNAALPLDASFTVTWTYQDFQGNQTQQQQEITIVDTQAPIPNQETLPEVTGNCPVEISSPIATDACEGAITGSTTDPVSYTVPGNYLITWTYTDSEGNASNQTQDVLVPEGCMLPAGCLGDLTGDGYINTADLLVVIGEFQCVAGCTADLDGDLAVTTLDVLVMLGLFGTYCTE